MKTRTTFGLRASILTTCVLTALTLTTTSRAFTLTANDLIGYVMPGTPSGDGDETDRLQFFVTLNNTGSAVAPDANSYTAVFGSNVPAVLPDPVVFGTQIQAGALPVNIATPYSYLMAKFGDNSAYYWLGGQTGSLTSIFIPAAFGSTGLGLSHVTLFNRTGDGEIPGVPEGGATVALLGAVLGMFAVIRSRMARG